MVLGCLEVRVQKSVIEVMARRARAELLEARIATSENATGTRRDRDRQAVALSDVAPPELASSTKSGATPRGSTLGHHVNRSGR